MAYNNKNYKNNGYSNYNRYNSGSNRQGYNNSYNSGSNRQGYNNSYNSGSNSQGYNNSYRKPKSGAQEVHGTTKDGNNYFGVTGWFVRRDTGLIKVSGFVNSLSKEYQSSRGNHFVSLMFEIFYQNSGVKKLELGLYSTTTGKVYLEQSNIIISTKTKREGGSGYCGFLSKKK